MGIKIGEVAKATGLKVESVRPPICPSGSGSPMTQHLPGVGLSAAWRTHLDRTGRLSQLLDRLRVGRVLRLDVLAEAQSALYQPKELVLPA